jgi:hypothetical protein
VLNKAATRSTATVPARQVVTHYSRSARRYHMTRVICLAIAGVLFVQTHTLASGLTEIRNGAQELAVADSTAGIISDPLADFTDMVPVYNK